MKLLSGPCFGSILPSPFLPNLSTFFPRASPSSAFSFLRSLPVQAHFEGLFAAKEAGAEAVGVDPAPAVEPGAAAFEAGFFEDLTWVPGIRRQGLMAMAAAGDGA